MSWHDVSQISNSKYLLEGDYLLADKAYELTSRCITPYKSPLADQVEGGYRTFNRALASMRIKIEHAFGMLKARLPMMSSSSSSGPKKSEPSLGGGPRRPVLSPQSGDNRGGGIIEGPREAGACADIVDCA